MNPSPKRPAKPRHHRTARGDVDRHRLLGPVVDHRVDEGVVLALGADRLLGPQRAHHLHGLAQPGEALLELRPLPPGDGDLVERLTGADAERDPVAGEQRHRRELLGEHRGVVAERGGQHRGADLHPLRALPTAAIQGSAAGAWPPSCRQGRKWSDAQTLSSPSSSASTAYSTRSRGPNCSADALYPIFRSTGPSFSRDRPASVSAGRRWSCRSCYTPGAPGAAPRRPRHTGGDRDHASDAVPGAAT